MRSYHVLTARPPRPLRAYGVSFEIYFRSATAITGDPAALSPRSWGSYHASSTCIASVRRPPGVSTTFSRRLYIKRIKFFGNFQMIIVQSYCTINIWCSISKFWISSDMMMNTKYSDENNVVVVRTPWNRGRVEDPMILLCKCNHFRGVFATCVLRMYYVYGDATTLGTRPSRPHRVLTAFQVRSPNLGVCFEHAQNKRRDSAIIGDHWRPWRPQHDVWRFYHVATTFIPRLRRPWRALDPFSVAVDAQ